MVKSVVLANFEQFSSHTKDLQVLGSPKHPTKQWMLLGEFKVLMARHNNSPVDKLTPSSCLTNVSPHCATVLQTKNDKKEQEFELIPVWVRYLKLRFLSHWGTEPVCTLSLLRVHGGGSILILDCEHMQGRMRGVTYLVDWLLLVFCFG